MDVDRWGRDYVLLGLRLGRVFPGLVDGYYGPPELQQTVNSEPLSDAGALIVAAERLAATLDQQPYEPRRRAYLARQVRAMETIARRVAGEQFSLLEEAERCFDIRPQRIPESVFEQAIAELDHLLPGSGSVQERQAARRRRMEIPGERADRILSLFARAGEEIRARTRAFIPLPDGEQVEITLVKNKPWGAYNWYLGWYRSRIEINTDLPVLASNIVGLLAHEAYPGHHTEHARKEQLLYREGGALENSILLINTPECVISEGIATTAARVIFTPNELKAWEAQHIYPEAGVAADDVDEDRLAVATHALAGVSGNAAILLHEERRPASEVVDYLQRYGLYDADRARKHLEFLQSPLWRAYTFTYYYGQELMLPLLQGENKQQVFRRFCEEPVYPSLLTEMKRGTTS
jgi:hypothetical protein